MSEQTANLCTTDACESLRARLAKYEDAEGRPVVATTSWSEISQRAALESQAREIDRLESIIDKAWNRSHSLESGAHIPGALDAWKRPVLQNLPYDFSGNPGAPATQYCNGWNDAGGYWKAHSDDLSAELAALKAQPSGVVLPERMTLHGSDGKPTYETKAHNACLDEVARLNSSPVSSAPTHGDGMCNADNPGARCICREEFGHRVCAPSHGEQVLYTHPADQVAEPDAELVELLRNMPGWIGGDWAEEVRAKLASLK